MTELEKLAYSVCIRNALAKILLDSIQAAKSEVEQCQKAAT